MRDPSRRELLARYLTVACPKCPAGTDEWCLTSSGRPADWIHLDRRRAING